MLLATTFILLTTQDFFFVVGSPLLKRKIKHVAKLPDVQRPVLVATVVILHAL